MSLLVQVGASAQAAAPSAEGPPAPTEPMPTEPAPADGAAGSTDPSPESLEPSPLTERPEKERAESESQAIEMPPPAARSPDALRFEVGGRLGYGVATGEVFDGQSMKGVISGVVPLMVDGWLRLPAGFALGLYAQVGIGIKGKDLDACSDCSVMDLRLGVQFAKHFNPYQTFDPWLGVGLGLEALDITQPYYNSVFGTYRVAYVYSAVPELVVQGGLDVGNDKIAFGPFASASYASFSKVSAELRCTGCDNSVTIDSGSIDQRSGHLWFLLGVRGTYLH